MLTVESIMKFHQTNRILYRGLDFMYLQPHPELRQWISNYTITFPGGGSMSERYTIIPDGCSTMVYSFDTKGLHGNLFGPITKPACVGHDINESKMIFIIEFQPAGYYTFSKVPQDELMDLILPMNEMDLRMDQNIKILLERASGIDWLIQEVDRLFMTHLLDVYYSQEFMAANQIIMQKGGLISVKELSQSVFYSERHLGRVFHKYLGVGTKSFSRIVRVNKALQLLRKTDSSILRTSMENGFYDDTHFIHDFSSICGVTPQKYRKNMSDFYSETGKF